MRISLKILRKIKYCVLLSNSSVCIFVRLSFSCRDIYVRTTFSATLRHVSYLNVNWPRLRVLRMINMIDHGYHMSLWFIDVHIQRISRSIQSKAIGDCWFQLNPTPSLHVRLQLFNHLEIRVGIQYIYISASIGIAENKQRMWIFFASFWFTTYFVCQVRPVNE